MEIRVFDEILTFFMVMTSLSAINDADDGQYFSIFFVTDAVYKWVGES